MLDIILMAMVAGFIALRLRSELGKKTGNEPLPPAAGRAPYQASDDDRTIEGDAVEVNNPSADVVDLIEDAGTRRGLADIRRKDSYFDAGEFLNGAQSAYGMVLEAFWAGDRETLADFLDETVLGQFGAAIDQREKDGLTLKNKLLEVTESNIVEASLRGRTAEITVHFTAEIIAVTVDADGKLVDGDMSDAVELSDKWTFTRETSSRSPNWTLVATQAG